MKCCVCDADQWSPIPDPVADRSITTAGLVLDQRLSKGQCTNCGLLQRIDSNFVGDSDFYEERYANYYLRAGASTYDAPRYTAMVEWMRATLGNYEPRSILDVGCGAGWSMLTMKKYFPKSVIEGVEPSRTNAELARKAGFEVRGEKIGQGPGPQKRYELIYSINVLQHVLSPVEFLRQIAGRLEDGGYAALICPDASRPSSEMLWCDHNFSFAPGHVARLAEKAGMRVVAWRPNPVHPSLLDKQLIVLAKSKTTDRDAMTGVVAIDPTRLYQERCQYVESWRKIHAHLRKETDNCVRLFNFGASTWTWLLAGYCPDYWLRVEACLVDQFSGTCIDKPVKPTSAITFAPGDCMVLGINPVGQDALAERFRQAAVKTVRWDQFVRA